MRRKSWNGTKKMSVEKRDEGGHCKKVEGSEKKAKVTIEEKVLNKYYVEDSRKGACRGRETLLEWRLYDDSQKIGYVNGVKTVRQLFLAQRVRFATHTKWDRLRRKR